MQHPDRGAACPLFWTLGGQQVGKAAISGWKEVIAPAVASAAGSVGLWPFDGALEYVVRSFQTVIVETYPAEFYGHLGVRFPPSRRGTKSGKRVQADRVANAKVLVEATNKLGVEVTEELGNEIESGFGAGSDGEDRFDAVVGLLGMLNVVLGRRASGEPEDESVGAVEGWILGQNSAQSLARDGLGLHEPLSCFLNC